MRYFECKAKLGKEIKPRTEKGEEICSEVADICDEYCENNTDRFSACVTYLKGKECVFILSGRGSNTVFDAEIKAFLAMLRLGGEIEKTTEISFEKANKSLRNGRHVEQPDEIEELMGITPLRYAEFEEQITDAEKTPPLSEYADLCCMPDLKAEAVRINACKTEQFLGHPVHYILEGSSSEKAQKTAGVLVGELLRANRLESGRMVIINEKYAARSRSSLVEKVYTNITGGTVLVSVNTSRKENEYADASDEFIASVCKQAVIHRNDVLTIFNIRKGDVRAEKSISSYLADDLDVVSLRDSAVGREECVLYLSRLAGEKDIHDMEELEKRLDPDTETYYISELDEIFNDFYNEYIKKTVFPVYSECGKFKAKTFEAEGKAADELAEMIGLDEVKSVISRSVNYFKLQKVYAERRIKVDNPARSMIFTGNPGTAKTTVARLVAKIFRDNGLLANGRLIEVGRGDLVGKFVGWTAPLVKDAFERAKGSVLFIDEAYSLVDDSGSFGDEAINTIVQEMENHREDTIVIFAGYPKEMEDFLNKNPGLRSRIAFHVHFPDYNEEELLRILRLMAENKSFKLADSAEERAAEIFREAVKVHDFGNGRFVRNLLENAMMAMSQRLAEKDLSRLSEQVLTTIEAEDFTMPVMTSLKNKERRQIGF